MDLFRNMERVMVGGRIQMARESRGLCLHDMAEEIGIEPAVIAEWEAAESVTLREEIAWKIRHATEYPVNFFRMPMTTADHISFSSLDYHFEVDPNAPCCDR